MGGNKEWALRRLPSRRQRHARHIFLQHLPLDDGVSRVRMHRHTHTHTHTHSMQILAHPTCTLPRTFTLPHTQKQNDTHTHTLGESITPAGRRMFSARAHQPSICLHNAPPLSIFECNCCRLGRRPRKRLFITLLSAAPPPSLIVKGTRLAMSMLNKSATVRDSTRRPSMQQRLLLMSYDAPAN